MRPRTLRAGIAVALIAGVLSASGGRAFAANGTAACQGHGTVTLTPGLTETPRDVDVTVSIAFGACISSDPTIHSATLEATGRGLGVTCLQNAPVVGEGFVRWDNGATSEGLVFTTDGLGPAGYVEAPVTGGQFRGAMFRAVAVFTGDLARCRTDEGLTTADFEELATLS